MLHDLPIIYLYHPKWLYAYTAKMSGFVPYPDGMIRPQGLRRDQGLGGGKMPSICPVDCRWRSYA
jgi:hypothetical protein